MIEVEGTYLRFLACGVVCSNPKASLAERLCTLTSAVKEVVTVYRPDQCAIEETFVNKNPLSSLKLGHSRGALIATIYSLEVALYEYAATLVKKTIVGVGRAEKKQMMMMVKTLLPGAEFDQEDAADALAVAICHTHHAHMNRILQQTL